MSTEFVGSKEQSQIKRGQNQDQTGSFTREKSLPPIANVSPPQVTVPTDDWQTRDVGKSGVQVHDSIANQSDGSPSGKVASNSRPVAKPAAKGNPV